MSRIRTIKPEFFKHEGLFDLEQETKLPIRVAYAGLWTCCDREGRFHWRPRQLKTDILPYDEVEFARILEGLERRGFIIRYQAGGEVYGYIPSWKSHQLINKRERQSAIPAPNTGELISPELPMFPDAHANAPARTCADETAPHGVNVPEPLRQKVFERDGYRCLRCGATEHLTIDHIFPRSMGGTHTIANLRTLCRSCNCARPVQGDALVKDLASDGLTPNDLQRICVHVHARGERKGKEGNGKEGKEGSADAPAEAALIKLPLNDGSEYPVMGVAEYRSLYPAVDVMQSLRNMRGWLLAHRAKRKTRHGVEKFIHAWLARDQDSGKPAANGHTEHTESLAEMSTEELQFVVAHWRRNGKGEPTAVVAELERRSHEAQA